MVLFESPLYEADKNFITDFEPSYQIIFGTENSMSLSFRRDRLYWNTTKFHALYIMQIKLKTNNLHVTS